MEFNSSASITDHVNVTFVLSPSFVSGDCSVTFSSDGYGVAGPNNYVLTVSGNGAMADYPDDESSEWFGYMSYITRIVIEEGVTHIGNHAFDGCIALISIIAKPATAPTLGTDAFKGYCSPEFLYESECEKI